MLQLRGSRLGRIYDSYPIIKNEYEEGVSNRAE
jgi:hypothetical protein